MQRAGIVEWLRALASRQCGLGSIPGLSVIIMWVEFVVGSRPCSEGFSLGSPFFLPPQKPTFLNSNSTWNAWSPLKRAPGALWCSVGKQITFTFTCLKSCRKVLDDDIAISVSNINIEKMPKFIPVNIVHCTCITSINLKNWCQPTLRTPEDAYLI